MEPTMPVQPKKSQSVAFIVALFIILLIIAFAMSSISKAPKEGASGTTQPPVTKTVDYKIEKVDLTVAQGDARLPKGFPADIPVEIANIFESYTGEYQNPQATQYAVSYTTSKTVTGAYNLYLSYMTKAGYTFTPEGKDMENGYLSGNKDGNNLSVFVNTKDTKTSVQISYVESK